MRDEIREWINPKAKLPRPGDHIKVVLEDGEMRTGLGRDFKEPILVYQVLDRDPFVGRQNAEQPEPPPPPPVVYGKGGHQVRMTARDIITWEKTVWIERHRWRWAARLRVLLCKIPHGGMYQISAELIDGD